MESTQTNPNNLYQTQPNPTPPMPSTHVAFILDNSGSMYHAEHFFGASRHVPIIASLPESLIALRKDLTQQQISSSFHVFSEEAISGSDLQKLLAAQTPRGTNIAAGFEAMIRSKSTEGSERVVVVFVSDGDDTTGAAGKQRCRRLSPLPMPSTLLTVAVGKNFPTSTVLNSLYGTFSTSGDASLPLVFPIDPYADASAEVMEWIRSQLLETILEIASGVPRKKVSVEDLTGMGNQDIFAQCKRWYNECTVQAFLPGRGFSEKVAIVQDCRSKLAAADELMRKGTATVKPLLTSNLRKQLSVYHLTGIREKLNTMLAQLNKGRLFEDLDDKQKKEFLEYGNVAGRLLPKAVKYHGANTDTTIDSLSRMLKSYERCDFDDSVVDSIHLCSLSEILLDAKANTDLFDGMRSMADILKAIAFIGRAVRLFPVPDCAQINPWLIRVKDLPCTLKYVNTHDLYCTGGGKLAVRDETINSLLLLGGDPACPGIHTHVQTFTATGNWLCYHNDARLAMVAAILVHVLQGEGLAEWKKDELALLRSVVALHTPENSKWWHSYCEQLATQPQLCLVTESPHLPASIRCQGLNKFILAVWCAIDCGRRFDYLQLRGLFQAFVVELLGRAKADLKECLAVHIAAQLPGSGALIEGPWTAVVDSLRATAGKPAGVRQCMRIFETEVQGLLKRADKGEPSVRIIPGCLDEVQYFGLTLQHATCIFANLASIAGIAEDDRSEYWPPLSEDEFIRALLIVHRHPGSHARNTTTENLSEVPMKQIKELAMASLAEDAERQLKLSLLAQGRQRIESYLQMRHIGLPCMLPAEYMQRYRDETARDIARDYLVDPITGLSAVACCYPACDRYLHIPSDLTEKQCRSSLKTHLRECCKFSIPGFHKCVMQHTDATASDILKRVIAGECLKQPFTSRHFGSDAHSDTNLSLLRQQQKTKYRHAVESLTAGDSIVLYHLIEQMQDAVAVKSWSYDSFRQTFDALYTRMRLCEA